jgi:hypothetical protein
MSSRVYRRKMKTREDAVSAIRKLVADLEHDPGSWENPTLDRYLDARAAWLEGYGNKHNPTPSWDFIIEMLGAARIYE